MVASRIFVSHSSLDDAITRQLVKDLRVGGAQVWMDETEIKHSDFIQKINEGLANCDFMVLVLTPNSLRSKAVEMEVNAALNLVRLGRLQAVVPFLAAACDMSQVPPMWATLHYYDGVKDYAGALAGLLRALDLDPQAATPLPAQPLALQMQRPAPAPYPPQQATTNPSYGAPTQGYPLPGGYAQPGMPSGAAFGPTAPPGYAAPPTFPPPAASYYGMAGQIPPGTVPSRAAYNPPLATPDPLAWQALLATGLGALGLIAWLLPICGFPVTISAIVFGVLGQRSPTRRTWAIVGLILGILAIVLTIANSAIGAYQGANGLSHP